MYTEPPMINSKFTYKPDSHRLITIMAIEGVAQRVYLQIH